MKTLFLVVMVAVTNAFVLFGAPTTELSISKLQGTVYWYQRAAPAFILSNATGNVFLKGSAPTTMATLSNNLRTNLTFSVKIGAYTYQSNYFFRMSGNKMQATYGDRRGYLLYDWRFAVKLKATATTTQLFFKASGRNCWKQDTAFGILNSTVPAWSNKNVNIEIGMTPAVAGGVNMISATGTVVIAYKSKTNDHATIKLQNVAPAVPTPSR